MFCYNCGHEIVLEGAPTRQSTCPRCEAFLHCCKNCRFYDSNSHNQCREPQADWVRDKELGNFCHYFEKSIMRPATSVSRSEDARKKLDALFKK